MKLSVGHVWTDLILRSGYGQSGDDPAEAQRLYVALMNRTSAPHPWLTGNLEIFVEISLDDICTVAKHFAVNPPEWANKADRIAFRRNSARYHRRAAKMKGQAAFTGRPVSRGPALAAYWAYEGKVLHGNDWPYYPIRSMCPDGLVKREGLLTPFRFGTRPLKDFVVYRFIPEGTPQLEVEGDYLRVRPGSLERTVIR